jgi:transposase
MERALDLGDLSALLRAQSLYMIFDGAVSIEKAADYVNKSHECVRLWLADFLLNGVASLKIKWPTGRQPKLSKAQLRDLKEIIGNPPHNVGYDGGCWNAAMICDLIKKMFKVTYSVKYLPQLLKRIGLSYQKAKYVAAKADPGKRREWLQKTWPKIHAKAKREKAMILFGDESSFALWGSLAYTWSPRGKQPLVPTNGNRKNLKIFGMIDYFTGKLIYQVIDGKLNGESYIKFLRKVMRESSDKVIVIQDGAPYHRSKSVKTFEKESLDRLSIFRLPSYSPDYNPIEFLWRKIKRNATHNVYFENFEVLTSTIRSQLAKLKRKPSEILNLFGAYN